MTCKSCNSSGQIIISSECDCEKEQLIDVKGVCPEDVVKVLITAPDDTIWTQVFVPEILCIPHQKPDVEQILSVSSRVEIISQRVVKTPKLVDATDVPLPNYEGTFTTGRKLVIEGLLKQKVIYVAAVEKQSVHAAYFDVPFSSFIVLPVNTPLSTKYIIKTCIEDIFICDITSRQIFKNVTLFIKATPLACQ